MTFWLPETEAAWRRWRDKTDVYNVHTQLQIAQF